MQKTAVGVMLAGFVFTFFALPAAGIDLLIDAVGFLFIFNAARALRGSGAAFGHAAACSVVLVAVAALQLLAGNGLASVLGPVRAVGDAVLFVLLARGFGRLLAAGAQRRLAAPARAVFLFAAGAAVAGAALPALLPAAAVFCGIVVLVSHIFILALLFFACILPGSLLY